MNNISVTLVYAQSSENQYIRTVVVPAGSNILQVIEACGICADYPEINLEVNKVGILSQVLPLTTIVQAGDRIEIYRPLIFDPMHARRMRAKGLVPAQREPSVDRQKTRSNDVVQPVHPFAAIDTHNPNDQD
jgi:uncharacterized protein